MLFYSSVKIAKARFFQIKMSKLIYFLSYILTVICSRSFSLAKRVNLLGAKVKVTLVVFSLFLSLAWVGSVRFYGQNIYLFYIFH